MSSDTKSTKDHDEIMRWVKERGGSPATIDGTPKGGEDAGLLRVDFPGGASNPPLKPISWDAFFEKFDAEGLVMLYQDEKADGQSSTFCKFVTKETAAKQK